LVRFLPFWSDLLGFLPFRSDLLGMCGVKYWVDVIHTQLTSPDVTYCDFFDAQILY